MTNEEIARLKVLASSVNPADAYTADVERSHDVADVLRNFAPVMGELERVMAERDRAHAEGRAAGLREALDACGSVRDDLRTTSEMVDGGSHAIAEDAGKFAAGASLCGEAVEALMGVTQ